jgi:hypothetical protein
MILKTNEIKIHIKEIIYNKYSTKNFDYWNENNKYNVKRIC